MKMRALLYSVGFLLLLTLLAGCGGGGGDSDLQYGASLTIHTDTMAPIVAAAKTRAIDIGAALDEGGIVTVYNFLTGEVVAGPETLDSEGKVTLDVPAGLTVAVVITGTQGDPAKDYRLSLIIPSVPTEGGEYEADPATSIAAEAIAQEYYKEQVISQDVWDEVLADAQTFVADNPDDDFSLVGTVITGSATDFGLPAGLGDDAPPLVVPVETNSVALAKNAVQQIKEAGVPLVAMVSQERPDVDGIFTTEVTAKYKALGNRLDRLIMPALFGNLELSDSPADRIEIFDLTVGDTYHVIGTDFERLVIENAGTGTAGKITITADSEPGETPAGTYTVEASKSGTTWTVTQTFTGDSLQHYTVTAPEAAQHNGESGANPSLTGNISVTDSVFTTPMTFNGTFSAVGADSDHYTQMTFSGTLTSENVTSSGAFQVNFPSTVPAGASEWDDTYSFPTAASMTNGNITVTGGGTTIALTGNISVEMVNYTGHDGLEVAPKSVTMTGAYDNSHSGLSFEGSITANWTNAPTTGSLTAAGTMNLHGELTREGHPTYYADITFTLSGGTATSAIDLRAGASTLIGTATGVLTADDHPGDSSLTLTNQAGVEFNLARSAAGVLSGSVKVGSETVATIADSPISGLTLRVTYSTTPESTDDI